MLTVYLSNKYIKAAVGEQGSGRLHVRGLYSAADQNGAILNGTVVDEEALKSLLKQFWQEHELPKKDVNLVLDSNQFTAKEMHVPALNSAKTLEYLKREFTGVERIADPVYGFFPIGKPDKVSRLRQVMAMAAPREYIVQFEQIFREIGVTLSGVESIRGVLNRLLRTSPAIRTKDCIIQIVDDMNLTSVLWVNGNIETSNRKRMFADPGTPAYSVEMSRAANNLIQFAKAQSIEKPIAEVYTAGISAEDLEIYKNSIGNVNGELTVFSFPDEGIASFAKGALASGTGQDRAFSDYAIVIGGLLKADSACNVLTQLKYSQEEMEERKGRKKMIAIASVLVGIVAAVAVGLLVRNLYLQNQLNALEAYNNDPAVVKACIEFDELNRQLNAASGIESGLKRLTNTLDAYPKVDSRINSIVALCAEGLVTTGISGYQSETGKLSLETSAYNVEQINKFVDRLMAEGIFADIRYTGYEQDREGTWRINVECILAPEETQDAADTESAADTELTKE